MFNEYTRARKPPIEEFSGMSKMWMPYSLDKGVFVGIYVPSLDASPSYLSAIVFNFIFSDSFISSNADGTNG